MQIVVLSSTERMYFLVCGKHFPVFYHKEEGDKKVKSDNFPNQQQQQQQQPVGFSSGDIIYFLKFMN